MSNLMITTVNFDIRDKFKSDITKVWLLAGFDGNLRFDVSVDGGINYYAISNDGMIDVANSTNIILLRIKFVNNINNFITHSGMVDTNLAGHILEFTSIEDKKLYVCNVRAGGLFTVEAPIGQYKVTIIDRLMRHRVLYSQYYINTQSVIYSELTYGKIAFILQTFSNQSIFNHAIYDSFENSSNLLMSNDFVVSNGYLSQTNNKKNKLHFWLLAFV